MEKIPHQLTKHVKFLQKIVLWQGEKFLILKRSAESESRPSQWDLPGGNVEFPQMHRDVANLHLQDATREIEEETGLEIMPDELKSCYLTSYFQAEKELFSIIAGFKVKLRAKPKITLSEEHTEFVWISVEEFEQYDFGFAGKRNGFIREIVMSSQGN